MRTILAAALVAAALSTLQGTAAPRDGFVPLFNGRDLSGWHLSRVTHQGSVADARVEDGAIVLRQKPYGQGGLLLTDRHYENFELRLEVKPDWGCNGGVVFRSTEGGAAYQIEIDQGRGTGSLFGDMLHVGTTATADRIERAWRYDAWNELRLRVEGDAPRIVLWVNGVEMWDVTQAKNDLVAGRIGGMIGLQIHWSSETAPPRALCCGRSWKPGAAHRYRGIAIKELP